MRIIGFLRDNATKTQNDNGDDNATAPRVSRLKVVIALLFNHCKEMKRLQEVANSKDVFQELNFVKCIFYQDQNDTFRTLNSLDELKFGEFITRVGMNFPVSHELDNCPWNICVTSQILRVCSYI